VVAFGRIARDPCGAVPDDVGVLKLLEKGDFTDGSTGNALVFVLETDLLHGDKLASD
jgi:hypothetical protein